MPKTRNQLAWLAAAVLAGVHAHAEGETPMSSADVQSLKVSNVMLRVSDIQRSVEFYRDRVGLAVRFSNAEFAALDGGSVQIMLNKPEQAPRSKNGGLSALTEIVLEVDDVRSAYRALKERGVPFRIEPRVVTTDGVRDLLAADFRDPDGHALSLTGWVAR